jgi:hypothetical protein
MITTSLSHETLYEGAMKGLFKPRFLKESGVLCFKILVNVLFSIILIICVGCIPVVKSSEAPLTPEKYIPSDFSQPEEMVMILPIWTSEKGYQTKQQRAPTKKSMDSPIFLKGKDLYKIPSEVGKKTSAFVVMGTAAATGAAHDFDNIMLFSKNGKVLIMMSPAWRNILVSHLSNEWRNEIYDALQSGSVEGNKISKGSFWDINYKMSPPEKISGEIREHFNKMEFSAFKFYGLIMNLKEEEKKSIKQYLEEIPVDCLSAQSVEWRQVVRN